VALVVVVVRYTYPLLSTDIWWQMAYGRHLLQNRTLVPDHAAFSWTYAANDTAYCAWIPEILLYLLHKAGGLPVLFLFRYLAIALLVGCILFQARRSRVATHPLTWLILILAALMSYIGTHVKPELFSFVLMTASVFTWMRIKSGGDKAWRWCWLLPVLMLVWVNCHGGFIFGLIFFGTLAVGEEMNALFAPGAALPIRVRRHLFVCLALSGLAILVTPYGFRLPLQLAQKMLAPPSAGMKTVRVYYPIFNPESRAPYFVDYFVFVVAILAVLLAAKLWKKEWDWTVLLPNAAFCFFYSFFLRATFFWAPLFALTSLVLLGERPRVLYPRRRALAWLLGIVMAAACVGLTVKTIRKCLFHASNYSWIGFGVSYFNPVEEAAFIRENYADRRLGNDYTTGARLLWDLSAVGGKVFIDPRYFPYERWYETYYQLFHTANDVERYVKEHGCEVWCVAHLLEKTSNWFRKSPEWTLVFYGTSAAVFVRKDVAPPGARLRTGGGIDHIRNLSWAALLLRFALNVPDLDGAARILACMEKRFRFPKQREGVKRARTQYEGVRAYYEGDYDLTVQRLEQVRGTADAMLASSYMHIASRQWQKQAWADAYQAARAAHELAPESMLALYDLGMTGWRLTQGDPGDPGGAQPAKQPKPDGAAPIKPDRKEWVRSLSRFLEARAANPNIPNQPYQYAEAILEGRLKGAPPLLVPNVPVLPENDE